MELNDFLTDSPIAKRIKLPVNIVIHRTRFSPVEIVELKKKGKYDPIPGEEEICELEVNREVIARGNIVKKKGKYFFKVTDIEKEVRA
jgi:flagellar motor switch/type III secretory pathway protein FliN